MKKIASIVRSPHGWNVLNPLQTMFVDIDFNYDESIKRQPTSNVDEIEDQEFCLMSEKISHVSEKYVLNFRLYRTYHGIRLVCSNKLFYPESIITHKIFTELSVDEGYRNCVLSDLCFAARVQPKIHRIDEMFELPKQQSFYDLDFDQQREWLAKYKVATRNYRVCEYICDISGDKNNLTEPEAQKVINIHDKLTQCFHSLPLA